MLKSILGEILKPELPSMLSLECERVNVRYSEHSDIEKKCWNEWVTEQCYTKHFE